MEEIDYDQISPGVRDLVKELREVHGYDCFHPRYRKCHAAGMECAIKERHVFIKIEPLKMVMAVDKLAKLYPEAHVEASYVAGGPAVIMLWPDGQPDS